MSASSPSSPRLCLALLLCTLWLPVNLHAQTCRNDLVLADGYTVGKVTLHVRHLSRPPLPTRAGELYDPAKRSASQEQLAGLQTADAQKNSSLLADLGQLSGPRAFFSCVTVLPAPACSTLVGTPRCVRVTFSEYQVNLAVDQIATFAADTPRSPYAANITAISGATKALDPAAKITSDDRLGVVPSTNIHTNLLSLPQVLNGQIPTVRPIALNAGFTANHSLQHNFYNTSESLDFGLIRPAIGLFQVMAHAVRTDAEQPLGASTDRYSRTSAGVEAVLHTAFSRAATLALYAGFQASSHTVPAAATETAFHSTAIAEGTASGLLTRSTLWFSAASSNQGTSYQRLEFFSSAYKEIPVATNQAVGLRVTGSYGATWGSVPAYALFYPGNNGGSFLFADRQQMLTEFTSGPTVRSLGLAEGTGLPGAGGRGFFGLSGTLTIPIKRWSRPLIPDLEVAPGLGVKRILKTSAIVDSESFLQSSLEQQGLSKDKASAQATHIINTEVAPTVRYIADQANLYAVKPLLLLDYARTYGNGAANSPIAPGAGLEFALVNVGIQTGYARTLNRFPGQRAGNFFLEIQFRQLF